MSNAKMNVMNKSRSQNDNKVWVVTRKRKEPVNSPGVCEATESRRTTGSLRCQWEPENNNKEAEAAEHQQFEKENWEWRYQRHGTKVSEVSRQFMEESRVEKLEDAAVIFLAIWNYWYVSLKTSYYFIRCTYFRTSTYFFFKNFIVTLILWKLNKGKGEKLKGDSSWIWLNVGYKSAAK